MRDSERYIVLGNYILNVVNLSTPILSDSRLQGFVEKGNYDNCVYIFVVIDNVIAQ